MTGTWKHTEKSHKTQTSQTPPKASSSWPHLRNNLLSAKFSTVFQSWRMPDPKLNASFSFPARKSASCEQLWLCAGVMEAPSSTELPHAVCLGRALLQGNLVPTRPASLGLLWVPATMAFSERWRSYKNIFLTGMCTHRDSKINFSLPVRGYVQLYVQPRLHPHDARVNSAFHLNPWIPARPD